MILESADEPIAYSLQPGADRFLPLVGHLPRRAALPASHIPINTGLEDSTAPIRLNIESMGFNLEDVKILLAMQAHFDHA